MGHPAQTGEGDLTKEDGTKKGELKADHRRTTGQRGLRAVGTSQGAWELTPE